MARELIVKPLGLVTRPNIYGQYPVGGMLTAQNLVMRSPGIIESAPALVSGATWGAANDVAEELFALDNGKIMMWSRSGTTWTVRHAGTNVYTLPDIFSGTNLFVSSRVTANRARGRVLMSSQLGHLVSDTVDPSGGQVLRRAGLQQVCVNAVLAGAGEVFSAANQACNYAIIVRREFSDGYEIASVPGPIYRFISSAPNQNAAVNFWVKQFRILPGDIIEIYRSARIDSAVATTDPGSTLNLVKAFPWDGVTFQFSVTDTAQFGVLGETAGKALYTNPGQKGALGSHRQPNIAKCSAMFKGYRFLGNITARPQLILRSPGGLQFIVAAGATTGASAVARKFGIGSRQFTGTTAIGNPTITAIAAGEIVGIVPGQSYNGSFGAAFSGAARVLSVGATTVTMTLNALTNGAAQHELTDMLEINGVDFFLNVSGISVFSITTATDLEVTASETYGITDPTMSAGQQLIVEPKTPSDYPTGFSIRATNGANYSPPLPEKGAVSPATFVAKPYVNTINWSNDSQPEHFPAPNETQVGSAEIIAFESTRDALWIFCTDGLFRLSGAGGQWRIDTADTTLVLASPRASCVLKEAVYAYTNQGLVRVTDAGTENLSEQIIGDLLPGSEYVETASIIVERNEAEDEVVIRVDASQVFIYSVREQTFTTVNHVDVTAMTYARYPVSGLPALAVGQSPSGSAPSYSLWNATASYLAPTARFHPLFAQDPLASKQWIDGTYIFDLASAAKSLTPAWNNTTSPASPLKNTGQFFNESRAIFGVPRRAAIGHTLAPGFSFGALSTSTKFYALSMRFRQLAEQNLHR